MTLEHVGFEYELKIRVRFTRAQLEAIVSFSRFLDDHDCIEACNDDGFVAKWLESLKLSGDSTTIVSVSAAELRTLEKFKSISNECHRLWVLLREKMGEVSYIMW